MRTIEKAIDEAQALLTTQIENIVAQAIAAQGEASGGTPAAFPPIYAGSPNVR